MNSMMKVCGSKYVPSSKKKKEPSSYSKDWLYSEQSGDEMCYAVSKWKSFPSASTKTPVKFFVSHMDQNEGEGPGVRIIPRIFRSRKPGRCMEAWRPGTTFESTPIQMIFPTTPCFGEGKFQGFTGVTRCPRDPKAYLAWQKSKAMPDLLAPGAKEDLEEFHKWTALDYCSRAL